MIGGRSLIISGNGHEKRKIRTRIAWSWSRKAEKAIRRQINPEKTNERKSRKRARSLPTISQIEITGLKSYANFDQ